jgi:hypothetical protein
MHKNKNTSKIERVADMSRFTKRIGSTVYKVGLYFKPDAKETIEDKILRMIKNEWNCSQKYDIIKPLQADWLSERSSS